MPGGYPRVLGGGPDATASWCIGTRTTAGTTRSPAVDMSGTLRSKRCPVCASSVRPHDLRQAASAAASASNSGLPSVPPISGSTRSSGCGIRPSTRRFGDRMPAMVRALPLRLASGVVSPDGSGVAQRHQALAFQPIERCVVGEVVAVAVRHHRAEYLAALVLAGEDGVGAFDAQMASIDRKRSEALRSSAPGSRPASVRIWKPLHTPSR